MPTRSHQKNETASFFHLLCKIIYLTTGKNFWFEDLKYPAIFMKIFDIISKIIDAMMVFFLISQWTSLYTQKHFTQDQSNSVLMNGFPMTLVSLVYASVQYYKQEVRELVFTLAVRLKEMSNDEQTERMMIKTAVRYLGAAVFVCSFMILSSGINSGVQTITSNATFNTVFPMWPDIEDRRLIAGVARVGYYIFWWLFTARALGAHLIILAITISLSLQFKILCKYFENLNDIFESSSSQADKERRYEDAFKFGIKMHSIILWCTKQLQLTGAVTFSVQVIANVGALLLAMLQMMYTERTLIALMPIVCFTATALILTGVFMWNAGDITIEASQLPTAMFFSGWHNCQKESSVRVRKLVTIAMTQAQETVMISCFGIIGLSYESYVAIVKSSYSLFSVIY